MKTFLTYSVLVIMSLALIIGYAAMCRAAREDRYSDQSWEEHIGDREDEEDED